MTTPMSDDDFWKNAGQALETGLKLKKIMRERGLRRCRCVCPRCGKLIHAVLAGRKDHLHMACEGACGMNLME